MDRVLLRRRIIIGWNEEPGRRWRIHREWAFTAFMLGPIIVGIESSLAARGRRHRERRDA